MAWRRSGDKPLSEPMMVNLLTNICVTRPQWVKWQSHLPGTNELTDGSINAWQTLLLSTKIVKLVILIKSNKVCNLLFVMMNGMQLDMFKLCLHQTWLVIGFQWKGIIKQWRCPFPSRGYINHLSLTDWTWLFPMTWVIALSRGKLHKLYTCKKSIRLSTQNGVDVYQCLLRIFTSQCLWGQWLANSSSHVFHR